jgi:hypothetical protein
LSEVITKKWVRFVEYQVSIDRDKLKQLSDEKLGELVRNDELECTFLHLASLRHFQRMLERFIPKQETIGAETAEDATEALAAEAQSDPNESEPESAC